MSIDAARPLEFPVGPVDIRSDVSLVTGSSLGAPGENPLLSGTATYHTWAAGYVSYTMDPGGVTTLDESGEPVVAPTLGAVALPSSPATVVTRSISLL